MTFVEEEQLNNVIVLCTVLYGGFLGHETSCRQLLRMFCERQTHPVITLREPSLSASHCVFTPAAPFSTYIPYCSTVLPTKTAEISTVTVE